MGKLEMQGGIVHRPQTEWKAQRKNSRRDQRNESRKQAAEKEFLVFRVLVAKPSVPKQCKGEASSHKGVAREKPEHLIQIHAVIRE